MMGRTIRAGNLTDKYTTRNPIYRFMMGRFFRAVDDLLLPAMPDIAKVCEIGCGEGYLTAHLARLGFASIAACDVSAEIIEVARGANSAPGVTYHVQSVYNTGDAEAADLIVCCEVLEHLEDPDAALEKLHEAAGKYCLFSVPREPLFRILNMARGKYLRSLGNTPGHIQHWSSRAFLGFISSRFRIIAVRYPIPWTVALCEPR